MKARVRQLRVELKSIKKGTNSVIEFVLCAKAIANSLLVVGDAVSEHDQIDFILNDLHEESNPLVMQMYDVHEPESLYDVKALLYFTPSLAPDSSQNVDVMPSDSLEALTFDP
ncbi:hypothetical protein KIW84_072803 [Lathyrus oleraceus]|uniref:Uncharacterized protein n=1 Tax=Pisum sativum TaxID=3888 RepID=A0A9D4VPJ5_PEA|nr:hypothetical protein KIW84_072803 [Pisum sativum]